MSKRYPRGTDPRNIEIDQLKAANAKLRAALGELIDGARGLSDLALQRVADKWEAYLAQEEK
jgi:hypothetical protein